MADGIYVAAAGMAAQQARIDALANDLSNADTTGYRSQRVGFADLLYTPEDGVPVGAGSTLVDAGQSLVEGTLQPSTDPLALAVQGPGFFQVRRADGSTALTRDGAFQLDAAGSIVADTGEQLVPPLQVPKGTQPQDITVGSDGAVTIKGRKVGQIALVEVAAPNALQPIGSNQFAVTAASGAATPATASTIAQKQLEASNVDVASAMNNLLDAQQSYQLASRAIQTQDQLLQIANELSQA